MGWDESGSSARPRRQNQVKTQGKAKEATKEEVTEYKWTELGALWENEGGVLSGKIFNPEAQGSSLTMEYRRLGYVMAAIARGDRVLVVRNKDKEDPGSNLPDYKILLANRLMDDEQDHSDPDGPPF